MNKTQVIRKIEASMKKIATERDKLRDIADDALAVIESCDEAHDELRRAVDALSQYL